MGDWVTQVIHAIRITRIKSKICDHFGEQNCGVAIKVASAESGLRHNAKGWNCYYGSVSKACAPADRHRAWSVDCGIFQINFKGQECPEESFNEDWNIEKAYTWEI